ncbi:MAG TPA: hypothetical protein PK537_04620, partial [Candidatus Limiplasma sp.]|nr:hypothetical protein [Candidatus Limiplasma sp.]
MKIDLTCPVELWKYTLPGDDNPQCTFMLNNISAKHVVSVQITLTSYGPKDFVLLRQTERLPVTDAPPSMAFTVSMLPTEWKNVVNVDLVIEKVWFADATVWRRGNAPVVEYESNAIPASRRLDQLRFVAGEDAVGYPQLQEQAWLCVCGRANDLKSDRCCRCKRGRDTVFASYTPDNVENLIAVHEQKLKSVAQSAREDASRVSERQETIRRKAVRRKRAIVTVITVVLCAGILTAGVLLWGLPAWQYYQASNLLSDGDYDGARAAFVQLEDYRDSQSMVLESDYRKAENLVQQNDLADAAALYTTLSEYKDSKDKALQANYQIAHNSFAAGDYALAAEQFGALSSYQDSEAMQLSSFYQEGLALYAEGDYTQARDLFIELDTYQDSEAQVLACDYQIGLQAFDDGDYALAAEMFEAVEDTQDVAEKLQETYYQWGLETQEA